MSLNTLLPWVLIAMLISTFTMVFGVSRESPLMTLFAAAFFSVFMIGIGFLANLPYWRQDAKKTDGAGAGGEAAEEAAVAARRNARLMATSYNWGGIALMAVYTLTALRWQHGWQYALGMVLLGAICFMFAILIGNAAREARAKILHVAAMLTAVQGVLAACGLVYLIGSGKLTSYRSDWAANYVFLFGGITMTALSAFSLRTHKIFTSRDTRA